MKREGIKRTNTNSTHLMKTFKSYCLKKSLLYFKGIKYSILHRKNAMNCVLSIKTYAQRKITKHGRSHYYLSYELDNLFSVVQNTQTYFLSAVITFY